MNLVQIQERLKDLPTQALMSYANGQNPQVPPYLALGELNRRKQMEQQAAQPPTGTVKDNIEQQMGLMQLQKARQGQMAQQSAMQGMQAPTIPQGTPEPSMQSEDEMAMAGGGLASLPTGDMEFGSGGIIAFANPEGNQLVQDPMGTGAEEIMRSEKGKKDTRNIIERLLNAPEEPEWKTKLREEREAALQEKQKPAPVAPPPAAPPGGIVNTLPPAPPRPPAPPAAPAAAPAAPAAAPVMSDAQKFQQGILTGTGFNKLPPEYAPPKQTPIGEEYMKYMTDREQKRREDALKREDVESARSKRDFFNALIAGGEATRGQKGIGALFSGTGRALGESMTAAEERALAFQEKQQQLADNDAKTKFEIANLRRAEERGDAKGVYDSKMKLYELKQDQLKIQGQVASDMVKRDAEKELLALRFEYDKKLKGIPQAQRETLEEQYVRAAVKAGKSLPDAIREVKTLGTEAKGQLTFAQASDDIDKWLASSQGMSYIAEARKAAKDQGKPMPDQFTIRNQLIKKAMEESGSSKAATVDTSLWGNPKVK